MEQRKEEHRFYSYVGKLWRGEVKGEREEEVYTILVKD